MATDLTANVDPIAASLNSLIAIVFPKSTSKAYPLAVSVAASAQIYSEKTVGGKLLHIAVFGRHKADAARALAVLGYLSAWKGVQIFSNGQLVQQAYYVSQVIKCFLDACSCDNPKAHCHEVIDDPASAQPISHSHGISIRISLEPSKLKVANSIDRVTFPCSYLRGYFRFQKEHPATIKEQIQASAVRRGCDWCPLFSVEEYKKVGERIDYSELFE